MQFVPTTTGGAASDLFTQLGAPGNSGQTQPARTKYLLLVFGFLRRLLDLYLDFADELERDLTPDTKPSLRRTQPPGVVCVPARALPLTSTRSAPVRGIRSIVPCCRDWAGPVWAVARSEEERVMLVPLRRWLSVPHMSRCGAGLSLLIALAVLLQLAAGVGLAYVAGFSQVAAALGNIRWVWLFALVGALLISFAGYYCAYRGIFRVEEGPTLSRRHMLAVVVAGFGGFFAHGRGALDQYALEAAGAVRRDAQVRATALAGLEHGVLAVGVCGAAIAVLVSGFAQPPADATVPWAVIPVPGFLVAFWAAGRYRARFRDRAGWRGALAAFLDSVYLIRVLFLRPHRWASAVPGMALFWAAEAFAAWAALAALGVRMNVAALIVGFGTGMVFTRRMGPLGGAGVLILVLPPALWYSGASLAAAVAGVFIYQVLFLWLPMPAALALLPTLRAMGEQRGPLAVPHEAGVTDHGRRQADLPSQPEPVAAPHRALVPWPGPPSARRGGWRTGPCPAQPRRCHIVAVRCATMSHRRG